MTAPKTPVEAGPMEIVAEWQGQAIVEPGVLYDERIAEHLASDGDVAPLVAWLAVTVIPCVVGNTAHDASKAIHEKALAILRAWRRRFGQRKIDEIKGDLLEQMRKHLPNGKITDEELHKRIDGFLDEV
jgi:hypothetical protein